MRRVAPPRPTPTGPTSSPASRTTRGKEHPTARLSGPGPGKVWHRVQELAGRAQKRLPRRVRIVTLDPPSRDNSENTIAWPAPRTQPACAAPFHIVTLAGNAPGEVRRRVQQDTTGHRGRKGGSPLPHPASPARLTHASSPRVNKNDSTQPSRQMKHTSSVEVAYHCAQHVRDVLPPSHTHPRPTPGHTPHQAPTNVPHPRNRSPGPDPTHMEGRTRRLLRHNRSQQRTPPKPSTDTIERGRRTARGYRNPTNYQPRIPLTAGDLDASTHTQL